MKTDRDIEKIYSRLKEIILKKSYKEGNFKLTSGKESNFYADCKPTTLDSEGISLVSFLFLNFIYQHNYHIGAVAGVELGGAPLVTGVSLTNFLLYKHSLPGLIIRKETKKHGTGKDIEGTENVTVGAKIALLEDVITTAGTVKKAITQLEKAGYNIGFVATIIDRQEGGREKLEEAGYDLRAIFTREDLIN